MDLQGRQVAVLGSTGSIGTQTLSVCRSLGLKIAALTAHSNAKLLEEQARAFLPGLVVVGEEHASALRVALADTPVRVESGAQALSEAATLPDVDVVVAAVVGIAGLPPVMEAAKAGKTIALANKESLVCGGSLVMETSRRHGANIIPVDSEHSAIFQCLAAGRRKDVTGVLLTASGGAFFGMSRDELAYITPKQALRHPNWRMGPKITVDSATLMNKGLELIEAMWLFGLEPEQVDIVVHRQSILHSAAYFADGSMIAQMGLPDMRVPIQYALTFPSRIPVEGVARLSLADIGSLSFARPDREVFSCLPACELAARRGGLYPAVANSANEEAVAFFLEGKLSLPRIGDMVTDAVEHLRLPDEMSLDAVFHADALAREHVRSKI